MQSIGRRMPSGFTLVNLLAVVGILLLLVFIASMISSLFGGRGHAELRRQSICQANLSAIGKAICMYSSLSNDEFPFPLFKAAPKSDSGVNAPPTEASTTNEDLPIGGDSLGDNAMQCVWLLMKEDLISVDAFHCPSDKGWQKRTSSKKYGWTSPNEFSYGVHYPYLTDAAGNPNPARVASNGDSEKDATIPLAPPSLVIFADRNPGGPVGPGRLPSNHPEDGMTLLKLDTSVSFRKVDAKSPDSRCGFAGDDIYVNAKGIPGGLPVATSPGSTCGDTSICPVPSR
jgi:hypothetical protein